MGWALWLALWALGGSGGRGCLRCDPGSMRLLRELKGPYLGQQLRGDPDLRARLEALLERSLQGLAELPIGEQSYMGVIGACLGPWHCPVWCSQRTGCSADGQLFNEVMWSLQELRETFTTLMARFQREARGGGGLWALISGSLAERRLRVQQDDDLILDCALTWHRASYGAKSYRFYRVWRPSLPTRSPYQPSPAGASHSRPAPCRCISLPTRSPYQPSPAGAPHSRPVGTPPPPVLLNREDFIANALSSRTPGSCPHLWVGGWSWEPGHLSSIPSSA
uniref:Izumo protein immunoglobulin domain-containing protein n=1 Tax=Chrysemys picta bellii TaxID=8478 RepID=A0A8C3FFS3_CHRPI